MEVRILAENTVYKRGFLGEHGLSMLIKAKGQSYLFDMGQSDVFLRNAKKMGEDLEQLDGIILSHGHYDHCGGMGHWARMQGEPQMAGRGIPIYINRKALDKKYSQHPATGKMLFSGVHTDAVEWMRGSANVVYTEGTTTVVGQGVFLLANIPHVTEFEFVPAKFWKEVRDGDLEPDNMEDEQILVVQDEQGLCVFAGCAHPGIINCLRHVQSCFPGGHIHSLVAGMHLKGCTSTQLHKTIQALQELEVDITVPLHCTGLMAVAAIKEALGERCMLAEVGKKIIL